MINDLYEKFVVFCHMDLTASVFVIPAHTEGSHWLKRMWPRPPKAQSC